MARAFPDYLSVDYELGDGQTPADYPGIGEKIEQAVEVTRVGLEQYRAPAVMWTGGKDSTLVLYFVREVAREYGFDLPPTVFIDHYEHFPGILDFVDRWSQRWGLDLVVARNDEIARLGASPGDEIPVEQFDETNRRELDRLDHDGDTVVVDADSFVGNHLLKTVALNETITEHGFDGIFSGVRWDEQEARSSETFFSARHDSEKYPPHDRVHPILQFDERAVWDATWGYVVPDTVSGYPAGHVPDGIDDLPEGIVPEDIPVSPKYFEGFRSLGTKEGSGQAADRPAWLQDLDGTQERGGRAQDKENIMERLRDLGYM